MGNKGDQFTTTTQELADEVLPILERLGGITSKKMFGGYGIFCDGKMFGMLDSKGNCFLKFDASNKHLFDALGSEQHSKMPYLSVPLSTINQADKFIELAATSISIVQK